MKSMMVIKDPEAFELLADETRRKILYLLRVKEMTVSELAKELGVTSQAVYHHIRKLLKGNMVEVAREERSGHLIESYYRATAEDFLLSHGKTSSETFRNKEEAKEKTISVLNSLKKLGFKIEFDDTKISQLVDSWIGIEECCHDEAVVDEIWNMDELNILTKLMATDFAKALLMSDAEFAKQQKNREKFRNLLLLIAKKDEKPYIAHIVAKS
jgi:DNA-binding transcriptional ArsR family regulator